VILIQIEMKTIRDILISTGIMAIIILPVDLFLNQSLLATAAMVGLGAIIYLAVLFIINSQIREDVLKTVKIRWIS
ncbi:MAG: hypothetical protein WB404_01065, partial [Methanoregula sp.]